MEDVGKGLARDWDSICDCVRVFQFEIVIGKKEFDGSKFCIRQVEIGLTQSPLKLWATVVALQNNKTTITKTTIKKCKLQRATAKCLYLPIVEFRLFSEFYTSLRPYHAFHRQSF